MLTTNTTETSLLDEMRARSAAYDRLEATIDSLIDHDRQRRQEAAS